MRVWLVMLLGVLSAVPCAHAQVSEATSRLVNGVVSNNPTVIRAALDAGADVNSDTGEGRTPLIAAVMFSRPDAVKLLLEKGADPDKRAKDPAIGNAVTAAFFAMNGTELTGRVDEPDARKHAAALEVLRLVAAKKPDFNMLVRRATTEKTALMMAAEAGAFDAVQILLDAGANPNAMNGGKYTALDYAVDRPPSWASAQPALRVAIVKALLAAGAKKDHKGADGVLPVDRAKRSGNVEIEMLLAAR
jgi:ankyrin repeat protein